MRERLAQGRLSLVESTDIAIQVSAALCAAHEQRVIHRDIKPENIVIRPDSLVKVLDFGLAKVMETDAPSPNTQGEGLSLVETNPGTILGTVQYMSPEQTRGLSVDERTDIWSLGCLFYEMVTGQPAFQGINSKDVITKIRESDPLLFRASTETVPKDLIYILRKLISKPLDSRFQSAAAVAEALKRFRRQLSDPPAVIVAESFPSERGLDYSLATQSITPKSTHRSNLIKTLSPALKELLSDSRRVGIIATLTVLVSILTASYFLRQSATVSSSTPPQINSLAVIPFKQLGESETDESLSQGIADALINKLSRIRNLNVRPIGAVLKYATGENDAVLVGREQKVDAVFEGNMLKSGTRIRLTARLIDSHSGKAIWSEYYEENLSDIFTLEARISENIVRAITPHLDGSVDEQLKRHSTANPEAYKFYLKGRYFWSKRTVEGLNKGAEHFQHAIDLDPNYALAYAGLADCYSLLGSFLHVAPKENLRKAKETALKAIALDESVAEAHASLAKLLMDVDWNWSESEREFRRAIELNPGYITAHHWYGNVYLSAMGRHEEAIAEMKRALELDPTSLTVNADLGWCYIAAQKWDDAIKQLNMTIEMDPTFWPAYHNLAQAYAAINQFDDALKVLGHSATLQKAPAENATLGYVYARTGRLNETNDLLKQELASYKRGEGSAYNIAVMYGALGRKDEAFHWLDRDYDLRDTALLSIKVDPLLEPLRDDPRFTELVRRFNFK